MHLFRILAASALFVAIPAVAQQANSTFELLSTVKPSQESGNRVGISMDGDSITIRGATLRNLITNTFQTRATLIFSLPKWADSDRFDIRARVLSDDAVFLQHMTRARRREIFQRLLADRFDVALHPETRTLPVYELVKTGVGPGLVDNPPPPPSDTPEPIKPGHNGRGSTSYIGTTIDATGVRIADLCGTLGRVLDRTVVDKTGLTGFYDVALTWKDANATEDTTQEAGASLFTALQEQLGLKLIPSKGPVEVLVVDKASAPKPD